jgi:hypothetical protein
MIPMTDLKLSLIHFIEIYPAAQSAIPFLFALIIMIIDAVLQIFINNSTNTVVLFILYPILGILTLIPLVGPHFSVKKTTLFLAGSVLAVIYWLLFTLACAFGNCLSPIYEPYTRYVLSPVTSLILVPFFLFYLVTLVIGAILFGFFFMMQQVLKDRRKPIIPGIICVSLVLFTFAFPEPLGVGYFAIVFLWVFQKIIPTNILVLTQVTIVVLFTSFFVYLADIGRLVGLIHFGNIWLVTIPVAAAIIIIISRIFPGFQEIKNQEIVIFSSSVLSTFIVSLIFQAPSGSLGIVFENLFVQAGGQFLNELSRLFLLEGVMALCSVIVFYVMLTIFQKWKWPRFS